MDVLERRGSVYTLLESFYTEGQGDGLGPATGMAMDRKKNYFVWPQELSKVFSRKYSYGAVFVPKA